MKICIVGPGYMSIPPHGWGAVEILIHDYRESLQRLGHNVEVINTRDMNLAVAMINACNPDFVHIQYEEYSFLTKQIRCNNVAVTSHYAYLTQPHKWNPAYSDIFWNTVNSGAYIFALNQEIAEIYKKAGVSHHRVKVIPNGVRTDLYNFKKDCKYPTESICLAKIETRKRQYLIQGIDEIKFVGNYSDSNFNVCNKNYLGEWSKQKLYTDLTNFANLVLLSDGEAHPLVCMEAMSAGLGLVISEWCTANLDTSLPFITVIPESKIEDKIFIETEIEKNREVSSSMRKEIREYSMNFDWKKIVSENFMNAVNQVMS